MPIFNYKAYDTEGHVIESQIEAETLHYAKQSLSSQKLLVANIKEQKRGQQLSLPWKKDKVSLDDLEFVTSELAILLNSGVKIDKGLRIVARSKQQGAVGQLLSEILANLKAGKGVAESFQTKTNAFDPLYINLISIGEKSGKLPQVFEGLASDLKFKKALQAKVTQALTYPTVILFVCVACLLFVFNYIVPQMGSIFGEGDDIPVYTAVLLQLSEWMINYQLFLFAGVGLVSAYCWHKRKIGRAHV